LPPTINRGDRDPRLFGQNGHRRGSGLAQSIKDLVTSWMWSAHRFLSISPPRVGSSNATYCLRRGGMQPSSGRKLEGKLHRV
jgi:hypothetical protein